MPPYRPNRSSRGPWRMRLTRWLRGTLAILVLLTAAWYLWGARIGGDRIAPAHSSHARAIDGDSFTMRTATGEVTVRIEGIDAPEYRQTCARANGAIWPCGAQASAALSAYVAEPGLACTVTAEDRYARRVARCHSSQTPDIGAAMVARGLAIANGRGHFPLYWQEQEGAEDARTGVWQGRFDLPADWRREHPR